MMASHLPAPGGDAFCWLDAVECYQHITEAGTSLRLDNARTFNFKVPKQHRQTQV